MEKNCRENSAERESEIKRKRVCEWRKKITYTKWTKNNLLLLLLFCSKYLQCDADNDMLKPYGELINVLVVLFFHGRSLWSCYAYDANKLWNYIVIKSLETVKIWEIWWNFDYYQNGRVFEAVRHKTAKTATFLFSVKLFYTDFYRSHPLNKFLRCPILFGEAKWIWQRSELLLRGKYTAYTLMWTQFPSVFIVVVLHNSMFTRKFWFSVLVSCYNQIFVLFLSVLFFVPFPPPA